MALLIITNSCVFFFTLLWSNENESWWEFNSSIIHVNQGCDMFQKCDVGSKPKLESDLHLF